jgi:hypothetical protein
MYAWCDPLRLFHELARALFHELARGLEHVVVAFDRVEPFRFVLRVGAVGAVGARIFRRLFGLALARASLGLLRHD